MKLLFLRHGETDVNRVLEHSVSGPGHNEPVSFKPGQDTDISLNVIGRNQIEEIINILPNDIDSIYASPLLRTKETATIVANAKGMNLDGIIFKDELKEYHPGKLDGLSTIDKMAKAGGKNWGSGALCEYDYKPWDGDSWETIYARVKEFIEELKDSHPDKTVLCVTSGGVIRMVYKILFSEKSPGITKHIMIKNGSIHEFKL